VTFVSRAQNLEDVSLYRALKSVKNGVYIDVGANDPIVHSVTCAFYERGWRGINIEPVNHWYQRLAAARPEDHNLKVAAADATGTLKLFEVVGTGLSTIDARHAASHRAAGFEVREITVPARRLDDICDELGVTHIHFLKIDVEGAESAVLSGIDLMRLRPWIIVVEATEPLSSVSTH
jgi:FkbM family methyltransferase